MLGGQEVLVWVCLGDVEVMMEFGVGLFYDGKQRVNIDLEVRGCYVCVGFLLYEVYYVVIVWEMLNFDVIN